MSLTDKLIRIPKNLNIGKYTQATSIYEVDMFEDTLQQDVLNNMREDELNRRASLENEIKSKRQAALFNSSKSNVPQVNVMASTQNLTDSTPADALNNYPKPIITPSDYKQLLKNTDIITKGSKLQKEPQIVNNLFSENPYHISESDIGLINNYRGTLKYTASQLQGNPNDMTAKIVYDTIVSPSLFNPFYGVTASAITPGVPLLDTTKSGTSFSANSSSDAGILNRSVSLTEIDDCSIKNLVKLSSEENSILGQAKYKYSDFMYCRDVGRISNNYMITLRRFSAPVQDNIFQWTDIENGKKENPLQTSGDIGRMITWFGTEENKLEDILKYSFKASWRELKAERQEQDSQESDRDRGVVGGLVNLFNKDYNEATGKGYAESALALTLGDDASDAIYTSAPYKSNKVITGAMYDANKIYEPEDTLRETNIYEGHLLFENNFTLTFNYKLRSYDNINAKSAFLDLLGNILAVTYKQGTFWPGEQRIIGAPPNKAGWNKANSIMNDALGMGETFLKSLANGGTLADAATSAMNTIAGTDLSKAIEDPVGTAKNIMGRLGSSGLGSMFKGMIKNQLGRPAVYAFDSLLTQSITGIWHVTIGNPLNPIASMGNLIIENTEITHSGPLGLDDFPTDIKVVITLKHAMPRDSVDIQKMFTKGRHSIYARLGNPSNFNLPKQSSATKGKPNSEDLSRLMIDSDTTNTGTVTEINTKNYKSELNNYRYAWLGDISAERLKTNLDSLK